MPELPLRIDGETIPASDMNQAQIRAVQRYTNVAQRDSLNPTPENGQPAWIQDIAELHFWNGSAWIVAGQDVFLRLSGADTMQGDLQMGGWSIHNSYLSTRSHFESFNTLKVASGTVIAGPITIDGHPSVASLWTITIVGTGGFDTEQRTVGAGISDLVGGTIVSAQDRNDVVAMANGWATISHTYSINVNPGGATYNVKARGDGSAFFSLAVQHRYEQQIS